MFSVVAAKFQLSLANRLLGYIVSNASKTINKLGNRVFFQTNCIFSCNYIKLGHSVNFASFDMILARYMLSFSLSLLLTKLGYRLMLKLQHS